MCAASVSALVPLYSEGTEYWRNVIGECRHFVECANTMLARHGVPSNDLLRCVPAGERFIISEPRLPSFNIEMTLDLRSWGPVICVTLYGERGDNGRVLPQSFELPVAIDGDGQTVAIYDEGRSFSPREVASFLLQYFHCCYPSVSFPC